MKKQEPLTESYFYILLCLYDRPRHGYGIMQKVAAISDGNVKIGSGTMYGAVSNMLKKGWIIEIESDDPEDREEETLSVDTGRQDDSERGDQPASPVGRLCG